MKKTIIYIALYFLIASCIEPLDIPIDYTGGSVVISATLTNLQEPEPQYLQIGTTADTRRLPLPVTDAVAYLFDNHGSRVPYTSLGDGRYELQDQFKGTPGVEYVIEVTLSDGRTYKSTRQKLPETGAATKASVVFKYEQQVGLEGQVTNRPLFEIRTTTQLPDATLYLRWTMQEVYIRNPTDFPDVFNSIPPPCFVSGDVDPQSLVLFNGSENKAKLLENLVVGRRLIDNTFLEKHYFILRQHSINADAYEYWRKVNILANQTGSIFDTPPAMLSGNFKCISDPKEIVYGFFEVQNTTLDRIYTLPSDFPVFIPPFCTYVPGQPEWAYEKECIDCLTLPNSTGLKPYWFK